MEVILDNGKVVKLRKLKMKDVLNAKHNDPTVQSMMLVAKAIEEINGEPVQLTWKDLMDWDMNDFLKVQNVLLEESGMNIGEIEAKKF